MTSIELLALYVVKRVWRIALLILVFLSCQSIGMFANTMSMPTEDLCKTIFLGLSAGRDALGRWQPVPQVPAEYFTSSPVLFPERHGGVTTEIYTVETKDGSFLFKVIPMESLHKESQFHYTLGQVGLAPRVIGTISQTTLSDWGIRLRRAGVKEFGALFTQIVHDAWSPKHAYFVPAFVNDLDLAAIDSQLEFIKHALFSAQVYPMDLQVLITADSNVKLIDFGEYLFSDPLLDKVAVDALFDDLMRIITVKVLSKRKFR